MRLDACCVAHTPLKPMHFRPISRINSAVATLSLGDWELVLVWYRAAIDSGEFMVIVAAVVTASHDGRPSLRAVASCSILLYTAWILGGAGTGPGREWAALMRDLRAGESLDMVDRFWECVPGRSCRRGVEYRCEYEYEYEYEDYV
jgi:hypothetical protein